MQPEIAFWLIFVANIVLPLVAIYLGKAFTRYALMFHISTLIWVLSSIFVLAFLALPTMPPDEEPGPGDGLVLLPVLYESGIIVLIYCVFFVGMLARGALFRLLPQRDNNLERIDVHSGQ
jgi:uncharacterized membrane-anchored protein YitT (DUF2179 family)